jgi:hypothetical protein
MTTGATYLLRLRLPDQPGALGQVAAALGAAGADIESIVVVERVEGYAVDDLLVQLPTGSLADSLVTAVSMSMPGVVVETVQRHHGRMRVRDELELLDVAASSGDPVRAVVEGLPELMYASYALAVGHLHCASSGAPSVVPRGDWLPLAGPRALDPAELWDEPSVAGPDCEIVAAPMASSGALVLGRLGGPPFRPGELWRLAHFANLVAATVPAPGDESPVEPAAGLSRR